MKPLDLTPRLAAVAAQVPPGARLADVGTDHAYLPVWLLLAGRIVGAVATDVNQGPLQRGQETAQRYGVAHRMDFRRCDGLAALSPGEVDTVVIAGMGGDLMVHILSAAPWTRDVKLILQPMSTQEVLRQWLIAHGYAILWEGIAREGEKFYPLFTATGGKVPGTLPGSCGLAGSSRGRTTPTAWPT